MKKYKSKFDESADLYDLYQDIEDWLGEHLPENSLDHNMDGSTYPNPLIIESFINIFAGQIVQALSNVDLDFPEIRINYKQFHKLFLESLKRQLR